MKTVTMRNVLMKLRSAGVPAEGLYYRFSDNVDKLRKINKFEKGRLYVESRLYRFGRLVETEEYEAPDRFMRGLYEVSVDPDYFYVNRKLRPVNTCVAGIVLVLKRRY